MGDPGTRCRILTLMAMVVLLPHSSSGHKKNTEIQSMLIETEVMSRFARTVITMEVQNLLNSSQKAVFDVELPKTAFISNFTMTVDNVTSVAAVREKSEAKRQYDKAVSGGRSAGLIQSAGRTMEQFKISVNVGAGALVTFRLTYEELLKRHLGNYQLYLGVIRKELVENFQIRVDIVEPQGFSFLEADGEIVSSNVAEAVKIERTETQAHIEIKPGRSREPSCPHCVKTLLDGNLVIKYDVKRDDSAGRLQVGNGYFAHYFAPPTLGRIPKNVVFVIDRSGSMYGGKIKQTREALLRILKDVAVEDHFGLVIFDDAVETWTRHLVRAFPENIKEAKKFVSDISVRGATDINKAIVSAAGMLTDARAKNMLPEISASLIIFLSDGQPTHGITNVARIMENVKHSLDGQAFLYCLGFGKDVDYNFLDKLALENGGFARRIYEDSDSAQQLQGFYNEVAYPMLLDVELQYGDNSVMYITQSSFKQYYQGSEIIVAGQIAGSSLDVLSAEVTGQGVSGPFSENLRTDMKGEEQDYIAGDFMERLWAYLSIEQLLTRRISLIGEEKRWVTEKALNLSLKYNFVTPLTSMVVTQPEEDDTNNQIVADKPKDYGANAHMTSGGANVHLTADNVAQKSSDADFLPNSPGRRNFGKNGLARKNDTGNSAPTLNQIYLWINILLCIFITSFCL